MADGVTLAQIPLFLSRAARLNKCNYTIERFARPAIGTVTGTVILTFTHTDASNVF